MAVGIVVSNADSGTLSVLALDTATGALSLRDTLAPGGMLMPIARHPDGTRLVVARRSAPLAAVTLAVDRAAGTLRVVGEGPLPASMASVAFDASGRWLLAASYGEHVVSVSALDAHGVAQPAHQVLAAGTHAHAIVVDPSNRYAFSTALGDGLVRQWRFDAERGHLAPNTPEALVLRPASGPRHFAWHPGGRVLYLLNELDATLDVLAFEPDRGTLAPVATVAMPAAGTVAAPWAADLHLRDDARFLYASERRSSRIAAFAVGDDGLRLDAVGDWPVPAQPRGFRIVPGGEWLVVAGQAADRVAVHRLEAATGALVPVSEHAVGRGPNWVETFPIG